MKTMDVPTVNIETTATDRPANRRLMRKSLTSLGMELAIRSARMVTPIIRLATSVNTSSRKE